MDSVDLFYSMGLAVARQEHVEHFWNLLLSTISNIYNKCLEQQKEKQSTRVCRVTDDKIFISQ